MIKTQESQGNQDKTTKAPFQCRPIYHMLNHIVRTAL